MLTEIQLSIKGLDWKFKLYSNKEYIRLNGKSSQGFTMKAEREAHFNLNYIETPLILHELVHVYMSSCCIDSAEIDPYEREEIFADLISHHISDIQRDAKTIIDHFVTEAKKDHKNYVKLRIYKEIEDEQTDI